VFVINCAVTELYDNPIEHTSQPSEDQDVKRGFQKPSTPFAGAAARIVANVAVALVHLEKESNRKNRELQPARLLRLSSLLARHPRIKMRVWRACVFLDSFWRPKFSSPCSWSWKCHFFGVWIGPGTFSGI